MAYLMFAAAELLGGLILYMTYRGVFDIVTAFATAILMIALSYHVLVRKPDGTSIRMACFTAALWISTWFSWRLFFEFRGWLVSSVALTVAIASMVAAGFATYSLVRTPPDLDID